MKWALKETYRNTKETLQPLQGKRRRGYVLIFKKYSSLFIKIISTFKLRRVVGSFVNAISSFTRIENNEDQSYRLLSSSPPQHFNPILYPDTSNFLNDFRFMRKSIKIDGLDIVRLLFLTTSSRDFCIFCLYCPIQFLIPRRKET